jgi:hypothetical protein
MHLLQVCNVGQIVGGTAACAWSITRAWPQLTHSVAFLSRVDAVTRQAFEPHQVLHWPHCTSDRIRQVNPDLVILHNIAANHSSLWDGAVTIQYIHSTGRRAPADHTVYCSHWLAEQCRAKAPSVLWQGVPLPIVPAHARPRTEGRLRIGRICTPSTRKWPDSLPAFYSKLAAQHPHVDWEFVGCPAAMQPILKSGCNGRATFHPAEWQARSLVWHWDALLYHHPTLTESFGRTVAEAARAGCIPIVDDRGGFSEQCQILGSRGCHTPTDFGDAITELSDPDYRQRHSDSIQQKANEHFSLASFGERLRSLIGDGELSPALSVPR